MYVIAGGPVMGPGVCDRWWTSDGGLVSVIDGVIVMGSDVCDRWWTGDRAWPL